MADIPIGDGGEEVHGEHAAEVVICDLLRVTHLHTLRIEVGCAEAEPNINEEHDIDDQVDQLVIRVVFQVGHHVLKGNGK